MSHRFVLVVACFALACGPSSASEDAGGTSRRDAGASMSAVDAGPSGSTDDAGSDAPEDGGGVVDDDAGDAPGTDAGMVRLTRSAGCGGSGSATSGFETRTVNIAGTTRTYHVRVPGSYDAERAYPIVFKWHGYGGNGLSGGLGIESFSGADALVVAADGLDAGWGNPENDLALFDRMLDDLGDEYCLDLDRVFSYGFSYGALMSNWLACVRGDVLRGNAAVAGQLRAASCEGQVADWMLHDQNDLAVTYDRGVAARARELDRNGCSDARDGIGDGCFRYRDCDDGYPVVWCETSGIGHDIRGDFAPPRVWAFFESL